VFLENDNIFGALILTSYIREKQLCIQRNQPTICNYVCQCLKATLSNGFMKVSQSLFLLLSFNRDAIQYLHLI
jgi:hypothetical protein